MEGTLCLMEQLSHRYFNTTWIGIAHVYGSFNGSGAGGGFIGHHTAKAIILFSIGTVQAFERYPQPASF